jgi:hypothetical protein
VRPFLHLPLFLEKNVGRLVVVLMYSKKKKERKKKGEKRNARMKAKEGKKGRIQETENE